MNFHLTNKKKHILFIVLFLILSITVRLYSDNQTDFDSYWLHAEAESIQLHGAALWVFHPASLFGYYPLSYPSGTMFFLASASTLSGLDMNTVVFLTSILSGIVISLLTLVLTRRLTKSWMVAYLAAFVTSLSPILLNYTSFNAAGRVLVMIFTLLFLWSAFMFHEKRKMFYLLLCGVLFIFSFLTHRTAQFIVIYIIAMFCALVMKHLPKMWDYIYSHKHYKKYIHPRYERSKYFLILDMGIVLVLLVMLKLGDLILRGRLATNFDDKIVEPGKSLFELAMRNWQILAFIAGIVVLLFLIVIIYIKWIKRKKVVKPSLHFFHHHYHQLFVRPQHYFLILLGLIALFFFLRQFFGDSFYSPSLQEYYQTNLLSGSAPWIVFANFFINYTTSVSALFVFYFLGFIMFLTKKQKTYYDWFLIFSFIGFSGLLLDKRYIRLYIVPLVAIFIAYGIYQTYHWIWQRIKNERFRHAASFLFLFFMIVSLLVGIFVPLVRETAFGEETSFLRVRPYWETGQYIRSLDCDCSTITTDELTAGVTIFASSGVPGGSHNVYYFVDEEKLKPIPLSWETIKNKIKSGSKIDSLWILPDWVLGGRYYVGRHTRYLFDRPYYDRINKIIMRDYNEQFYIHDKLLETNDFLDSINPVKNVIYDTSKAKVYDLERGRDDS